MVLLLFAAIVLISSYAFIGGGIKYLDQLVDEPPRFQKQLRVQVGLTLGLILVTSLVVFLDYFTAILAIALLLGLLFTRKVDNRYFAVIAISILPIGIWVFLQRPPQFLLASLIPLLLSAITDELLHGVAPKISSPPNRWLLAHRPVLKITVLILPIFGLLTFIHTVAFWSFDIAYDGVAYALRAPNANLDFIPSA